MTEHERNHDQAAYDAMGAVLLVTLIILIVLFFKKCVPEDPPSLEDQVLQRCASVGGVALYELHDGEIDIRCEINTKEPTNEG